MEGHNTNPRMEEYEGQLEVSNLPPKVWRSEVMVSVTGEPPSAIEQEEIVQDTVVEIIQENTESLSLLDVLRISTVLEDAIDQLSILNFIMPVQYERSQSTSMKKSKEVNLEGKSLDKFQVVSTTAKMPAPFFTIEAPKLPDIRQRVHFGVEFNNIQDHIFTKPTRQTILTTETLKKIQMDRQFFSDVITDTMQELEQYGTFTNLLHALGRERENKIHFYDIIAREDKGRKQIRSLQRQLINVKKERQVEVQKLEEKLEFWMEKFDKDTETKQNELNALKAAKASDLAHLQDLARMLREYEQVIIEDRIEKEKTRRKIEQDELELKSVLKLQAWWRGTVIRNEIGGFRLPKKEKEDSKDSKGKGKDKDKRRSKKQK
ncbi:dynein regulatory complex protein 9 isoform X4 [Tamandua tetradactyla]|uniref:dynein regulatory complex protein 9 isoform X4 n=1 Tax=Tamandua tetradactyla TaxID=48850 RepID=UPI0040547A5D